MRIGRSRTLGKTGLEVGPLGVSSSFGAPCEVFEEAFEHGLNYFTWGTFVKGRSAGMGRAIRNLVARGLRDKMVIAMYSYAHNAFLTERFLGVGLEKLGTTYADILILGYFSRRPRQGILDGAQRLREKGMVRFLALSGHNRKLFPALHQEGVIDVCHVRYNAAHRGAETEVFPLLAGPARPGIVTFTATRWGQLLNPKKMPPGETAPSAADCYRFVLSNPHVDVCMMGVKNREQLKENLAVLDEEPMTAEELERMRRIGDHLHGQKRG